MNDTAASLYAAWYEALPAFFRGMMPPGSEPPARPVAGMPSGLAPPLDQIGAALGSMNASLAQLYQSYLPFLTQGNLGVDAFNAVLEAGSASLKRLQDAAAQTAAAQTAAAQAAAAQAAVSLPDITRALALGGFPSWNPWFGAGAPAQPDADATQLLQLGMERVFGGLGDAFGLRPVRELEAAGREIAAAAAAKQRAQAEYLALWAEAWNEGTRTMLQDLAAMGARGERIESLLALIRMWAKNVDAAVHDAMQSERGLALTAEVTRAATAYRRHMQRAVALASESMHLPTQADVDEAYREIQELKRELRRVKKALPAAAQKKLRRAGEGDA